MMATTAGVGDVRRKGFRNVTGDTGDHSTPFHSASAIPGGPWGREVKGECCNMATLSPMTWNWNWKVAATAAAAVTGWFGLGTPIHMSEPAPRPPLANVTASDFRITASANLQEEARRLDARLEAVQTAPPSRNLFQFGARPVARRTAAPAPIV